MSRQPLAHRLDSLLRPRRQESLGGRAVLLSGEASFHRAQALVAAFYAFLFLLTASQFPEWSRYGNAEGVELRWPLFWVPWVGRELGISLVLVLHQLGGIVAITLTRYRAARVFVFVSLLLQLALRFSLGGVHHGSHLGLLLSFVLIFLPDGWISFPRAGRAVRTATLLVFSSCQALILLIYSMSGLWKVVGLVRQLVVGEAGYLHPYGFARQVAAKLLGADATSLLGPWLIEHAWLGFPLGIAAIYFEFTALGVLHRPSLHQLWALALIALHIGSYLTMSIGFIENVVWLTLFLMLSPFRPQPLRGRRALSDLPLLGAIYRSRPALPSRSR